MRWMLDIQLGRRNLSPIQRIAVAEKYRPIYERQAKKKQGTRNDLQNNFPSNLTESKVKNTENETNTKLANIAGVKPTTYKMGAKVLNSDNEELKQRVLSGDTSISAGYKELIQTNIRQRGIGNPNPIKLGRCIKELERIYGIREGSAGNSHTNYFNGNSDPKTEKDLADRLGVTQQTIQNYKKLTELVPELQDWVEIGILAPTTAIALIIRCAYDF